MGKEDRQTGSNINEEANASFKNEEITSNLELWEEHSEHLPGRELKKS